MSKKLDNLKKQFDSIKSELEKIIDFRDTSFLKKFQRQLEGEKSVIVAKIKKLTLTKEEKQKLQKEKVETANKNRKIKNIRNWKFWKSIKKNYRPDLSLRNIRSQWKKHRQGLETDIPDVAWRNPSP